MAAETLFKDMRVIHARLLDHHPVIQSEITYCLKEFEEKRNDREQNRLQMALEYCRETGEKLIPNSIEIMQKNVPELLNKIQSANEMCNDILAKEDSNAKGEWLKEQRAQRVEQWTEFMDKMCEKSAAVDAEHEDEVRRVKKYYSDLEQKLMTTLA